MSADYQWQRECYYYRDTWLGVANLWLSWVQWCSCISTWFLNINLTNKSWLIKWWHRCEWRTLPYCMIFFSYPHPLSHTHTHSFLNNDNDLSWSRIPSWFLRIVLHCLDCVGCMGDVNAYLRSVQVAQACPTSKLLLQPNFIMSDTINASTQLSIVEKNNAVNSLGDKGKEEIQQLQI